MICSCKRATFKYDILGRLKSIRGELIYYEFKTSKYLDTCCFGSIISALYTLKDPNWIKHAINISICNQYNIKDANPDTNVITKTIFKIEPYMLEDINPLLSQMDAKTNAPKCTFVKFEKEIRLTEDEIHRLLKQNKDMYSSLIESDKRATSVIHLYNTMKHDKDIMRNQIDMLKQQQGRQDTPQCDSVEIGPMKRIDSSEMIEIKQSLKDIKRASLEKIAKYEYELQIANKKIKDLKENLDTLLEELSRAKETTML